MTFATAARTSADSAAFDTIPIVPSINNASQDNHHGKDNVTQEPNHQPQAQPKAEGGEECSREHRPHGDRAP